MAYLKEARAIRDAQRPGWPFSLAARCRCCPSLAPRFAPGAHCSTREPLESEHDPDPHEERLEAELQLVSELHGSEVQVVVVQVSVSQLAAGRAAPCTRALGARKATSGTRCPLL